MTHKRGEIWWASLPHSEGSGPRGRRPVLVLQADSFNRSSLRTVVIVALTSNPRLALMPGNVALTAREGHLKIDSVVNVTQIYSVDELMLTEKIGRLKKEIMEQVAEGIRLVLGI